MKKRNEKNLFFIHFVFSGSSVVTPAFLQTGEDLLLTVMRPDDLGKKAAVFWKFNKNGFATFFPGSEPDISPGYNGRLEFPARKYSVKLKNVTKADSGVYTVQQLVSAVVQTVEEYNVTVQGRFVHISDADGEFMLPCF